MAQSTFTVILTAEAQKLLDDYIAEHNCTRNKAVNELILSHKANDILKYVKAIYSKLK